MSGKQIVFIQGGGRAAHETVPFAHLALYAEKLPQAHTRSLDRGHQLNNHLSEAAADIESLGYVVAVLQE